MYAFTVRLTSPNIAEILAEEMYGIPSPVHRVSGKVKAWTKRHARRIIRKQWRSRVIEIVNVERA